MNSDLIVIASPTNQPLCTDVPIDTDGPFPFTVAVWREHWKCRWGGEHSTQQAACNPTLKGSAIVELVEITGPSHHADECRHSSEVDPWTYDYCTPDALPGCWHTPTGTVTPIGPILCERPARYRFWEDREPELLGRPSVWVADAAIANKIREYV